MRVVAWILLTMVMLDVASNPDSLLNFTMAGWQQDFALTWLFVNVQKEELGEESMVKRRAYAREFAKRRHDIIQARSLRNPEHLNQIRRRAEDNGWDFSEDQYVGRRRRPTY